MERVMGIEPTTFSLGTDSDPKMMNSGEAGYCDFHVHASRDIDWKW
jgi:hypothetical protein